MKQIELANGRGFALVDDEDYEWLSRYRWNLNNGYAQRAIFGGQNFLMHREILGLHKGDGKEGDHINGNRLDNRRQNLRVCTRRENGYNKQKTKGRSKYKGVTWNGPAKQWQVQIACNGKDYHPGCFDDEVEAAIAYDHAARNLFGEFATLNFPDIDRPPQGQRGLIRRGVSGYFGVYPSGHRWEARIKVANKNLNLGTFDSKEEAARAFDEAARKYRGHGTRTNFHY